MKLKRHYLITGFLLVTLTIFLAVLSAQAGGEADLTPKEQLGKMLYFDENLSANGNQSCASCHDPAWGYAGPDSVVNEHGAVYAGSFPDRFGNRRPPTAAYAFASPILHYNEDEEVWIGGMFWDGRATGEYLGLPLAEQAKGPFLNPVEQALPDATALCLKVAASTYVPLFVEVWGSLSCATTRAVDLVYDQIGLSIAAYEASAEVNPFTSKYDYFLRGEAKLNQREAEGLVLFEGKAMCSACHPAPYFTDFTYDNLGVPRNPENPWYEMPTAYNPDGYDWIDYGLGGFLQSAGYTEEVYEAEMGKHKVPTLRNADMRPREDAVKAYMHNGAFHTLYDVVHFYNTRDVEAWPEPEVAQNVNEDELGDLGLSFREEKALVAFLRTLTDGYDPQKDKVR